MGATQSRITFETAIEEGEGVSQLVLTVPRARRSGRTTSPSRSSPADDLLTRTKVEYRMSVDGQDIVFDFSPAITQAGHLSIMIDDVYFPQNGGEMQVAASYTDATGKHELDDIPPISVQGISTAESIAHWLDEQPWVEAWNSNRFLHLFFDPTLIVTSFPVVLNGFFTSIAVVATRSRSPSRSPPAARYHAPLEVRAVARHRHHLRELHARHAALPADLRRVLRTSARRPEPAQVPARRDRAHAELRRLHVRDLPRGHPLHRQGADGGGAQPRHGAAADHGLHRPARRCSAT